jgi:CheY-like chemotaxis protein
VAGIRPRMADLVNPKLKTVLFVDDSHEFVELLLSLAQQAKGDRWNVLTASTTAQALRFLEAYKIDLAVLDLRMPIVDGIQFLQLIHRKYPQMKKALLSSYPDDARRQNATQHGAELVLTKPLDFASFEILFETLDELLLARTEDGFRGVLRTFKLEEILQMECLSRHTSLLEVTANGELGLIYIHNGKIIHADFGNKAGEAALYRLLALKGGEFHHIPYHEPETRTIDAGWEFLLMESARQRDELAVTNDRPSGVGAPKAAPKGAPKAAAAPLPPACKEIVIVSQRGEVLYEHGATDKEGRAAVMKLLRNVGSKVADMLPFGPLERVEFPVGEERSIIRIAEQGAVFVRGSEVK